MTSRPVAPGFLKPLAILPVLAAIAAVAALSSVLARAEPLAALEATRFGSIGPKAFDDAIALVAFRHHLLSSQTSLVAADSLESRPDGKVVTTPKVPLSLPDGWVYDKVYGRPAAGTLRATAPGRRQLAFDPRAAPQPLPRVAGTPVEAAEPIPAPPPQADTALGTSEPAPESTAAGGVAKPQETAKVSGVEPSARNGKTGQIAMFVFLLIFLSSVTLLMWRHYRRDNASPRRIGRRI
jgi:hypothetical protein